MIGVDIVERKDIQVTRNRQIRVLDVGKGPCAGFTVIKMLVRVVADKGINGVKQHVGRSITHAVECQDHHRRAAGAGLVVRQHTGAVVSQNADVIIV